jgi:hypothetical protein
MKRFISGIVVGVFLTATTLVFASSPVKLLVNGQEVYSDVPPQIIDGRTMIPARPLAEALGAAVTWNEAAQTVNVFKSSQQFSEPQPINYTGQIEIIGSSEFKADIAKALDILKNKAPDDYRLVSGFIYVIDTGDQEGLAIAEVDPFGSAHFNQNKYSYYKKIFSSEWNTYLAGTLVHEAYHVYTFHKGLNDFNIGSGPLSPLEKEILAFGRERQFFNKVGASAKVKEGARLDYVVDTNYNNYSGQ